MFGSGGARLPRSASYVAYFGLAFFATRWWKLADRRRPRRLRLGPVLAAAFWGYILLVMLPSLRFQDKALGAAFIALVGAAIIVQWVSPWEGPAAPRPRQLRLRGAHHAGHAHLQAGFLGDLTAQGGFDRFSRLAFAAG